MAYNSISEIIEICKEDGISFYEAVMRDTCKDTGMTVIVITHNSALTRMADRVIKIKNGQIMSCEINTDPVPVSEIEW